MEGKIEIIDNRRYYIIRFNDTVIDIKRVTYKGKDKRLSNNNYNKIMQSLYNNNN